MLGQNTESLDENISTQKARSVESLLVQVSQVKKIAEGFPKFH
jgi:hypothetical protein